MTTEPTSRSVSDPTEKELQEEEDKKTQIVKEVSPLENLFYLGKANSPLLTILEDKEKGIELKVKFRTLYPAEYRDIADLSFTYESAPSQMITEKIETLARAVISLNHMPLALTQQDREEYFKKRGKYPTPLEEARVILYDKINSEVIIDSLYEAFVEWSDSIIKDLKGAKKKLSL